MKHTIAQNRQLFNVKEIANAVTLDELADGQFGVFPADGDTSVASNATYAQLPEEIRIISRLNGQLYYSFDSFKKANIYNANAKAYTAGAVNIWEATLESCDCIKTATVKIGIEEESLLRRDGLSWTDTDNIVESAPKELSCICDCTGKKVYDNNIMTKAIVDKINSINSPFYTASIKLDVTGITAYADQDALDIANATPDQGDLATLDDDGVLVQFDGTDWQVIGTEEGAITDVDTFIATNKEINSDSDDTNDGALLTLVIEGKPTAARNYKDLDVNHIYPRGVKLFPSISFNGGDSSVEFTETQDLAYEIGAGADIRAEEFENMSYYTNLNHYPQLHDGIATENLIYQFENGANYSALAFEFVTDKVNKNDGDKRSFGVVLASATPSVYNALVTMFKA